MNTLVLFDGRYKTTLFKDGVFTLKDTMGDYTSHGKMKIENEEVLVSDEKYGFVDFVRINGEDALKIKNFLKKWL